METFRGRHVLLAEDNKTNQEIVTALLENTGIRVSIASDGQKAVNLLEAGDDVDLILMDIHMPHMNGYHATKKSVNTTLPFRSLRSRRMPGGTMSPEPKQPG